MQNKAFIDSWCLAEFGKMAEFNQLGLELTPKLCLLDFLGGGLGWVGYGKSWKQAQLGVPHSRIQVELEKNPQNMSPLSQKLSELRPFS